MNSPADPQLQLDSGHSGLSVSLAATRANAADSVESALDDAVEKLNSVIKPNVTKPAPVDAAAVTLELMNRILQAPSRRDAVAEMVDFLATLCPDCSVRCGMGKSNLNLLYDHRLGWLGSESSLHQDMSGLWGEDDEGVWPSDHAVCARGETSIRFSLPNSIATSRCEIRIEGGADEIRLIDLRWLQTAMETVGNGIWSRPARSMPSIAVSVIRRGKLSLSMAGIVLCVLALWPVHYRVASTAKVETTHQRIVSAPFEATLLKSNVRPGDQVAAGDVLFTLDGRPLRLEREGVDAEIQQAAKEHNVALATGRIADAQQASLRKKQLTRRHDLISDRLGRLEVASPIAGVIVNGDLERFEGSTLDQGQTLIEVAPMDKMILEVEIPECEIGYVSAGATTRVKIDAIGGRSMELPLQSVFPRSELRDDRNVFIARTELDNTDQKLRPGMRGEAITYGPIRPWIWSWGRTAFERVLWWIGY
ncbi:MAG: efflux RND transporter periplasmic adaptor subunit [Rubripirellula sp.]